MYSNQNNHHNNNKAHVLWVMLAMSIACVTLSFIRYYWTQQFSGLYLLWNLFLAWVPLIIAYKIQQGFHNSPKNYTLLIGGGFLRLLFFPNSPYLITDLIHLRPGKIVPLWYDATLLFSYAMTGLFAGYISLYFMHEILNRMFHRFVNWLVIFGIFVLSGYGIYLGRVLRLNSWDLFTRPKALLMDVTFSLKDPEAIVMTLVFTFFMIFSYLILHSVIHLRQPVLRNDQYPQIH